MKFPNSIFFNQKSPLNQNQEIPPIPIIADTADDTDTNTNKMVNLNIINTLHGSRSRPGSSSMSGFNHGSIMDHLHPITTTPSTTTTHPLTDTTTTTTTTTNMSAVPEQFSADNNTTPKYPPEPKDNTNCAHRDSAPGTAAGSLGATDIENNNSLIKRFSLESSDNNSTVKRFSLERSDSCPWDDSGFSSSGFLSDDKDDVSLRSHDCSFGSDDKPFPLFLCSRARSQSVDSFSSDMSDNLELYSKLSSSLPSDYSDGNSNLLSPFDHSNRHNLSHDDVGGVWRKSTGAKTKRRKLLKPKLSSAELSNDLNNNNWSTTTPTTTNLQSQLRSAPFQFASVFRNHGLMSLVACICYTLFLAFLFGFLAIIWHTFSRFISKKDLNELRVNLIESRRRREMAATLNLKGTSKS